MATDKKNELLTTYTSDVHALIAHGVQAIQRQVEQLKDVRHESAKVAVGEFLRVLEAQKIAVEARVKALGGSTTKPVKDAVSAVAGVAAGLIDAVRPSKTTKAIRDDSTYFSHLSVAWLMLHTTASSLGDIETTQLAERSYADVARLVMHIDAILPKIVVEELREEVQALDTATKTRDMVRAAWNREAASLTNLGGGAARISVNPN